jgi:threonine dehydratase
VLFKREDMQPVFSFKLRGAYNKIAHLTAAEKSRGIIAASAGNHARASPSRPGSGSRRRL